MAFKDLHEKMGAEEVERGYSLGDLEKLRRRLYKEATDWGRAFDGYIDEMIKDRSDFTPALVVQKAASLANARAEMLNQKFGDRVWEE